MNDKERYPAWFRLIFGAGCVLFGILMVMFVLTSLITGISMSLSSIIGLFGQLFAISIYVLFALILFGLFMAFLTMKRNPSVSTSMVVRDNYLKYDAIDKDGRKRKKTVSLANINDYLTEHGSMNIIDGLVLSKGGNEAKANIRNLYVGTEEKKISLAELYNQDQDAYNRIAAFLDHISMRDKIALEFHLHTYVFQQDMLEKGKDLQSELKQLQKGLRDEEVADRIGNTLQELETMEKQLDSAADNDKLRKLYTHYVPMLAEIIRNYRDLDEGIPSERERNNSKEQLMQTFDLIDAAFASLNQKEDQDFEKLETSSESMEQLLQTKNGHKEVE